MTTITTPTSTLPQPVAPRSPIIDWHLGSLMLWHVLGTDTDGLFTLGEVVVRPGCEPPLHVHAREDETFYVLEGEVLFQRGAARILAGPGAAVHLPRGIPHGFAVRSPLARLLHVYSPSGIEAAFRAVGVPAPVRELPPMPEGPPSPDVLAAVERAFGNLGVTFVGPPLPVLLDAESYGARH